jgi:hypothetical protein
MTPAERWLTERAWAVFMWAGIAVAFLSMWGL